MKTAHILPVSYVFEYNFNFNFRLFDEKTIRSYYCNYLLSTPHLIGKSKTKEFVDMRKYSYHSLIFPCQLLCVELVFVNHRMDY